jgi:tetratricopeptide (TPR) repeat protein
MDKIFEKTDCLTDKDILAYLSGKMGQPALRRVERHLVDCPLCSDAVEGYASLHPIERELPKSMQLAPVAKERRLARLATINRVAAAVLLLAIPISLLLYHNDNKNSPQLLFSNNYVSYESDLGTVRGETPDKQLAPTFSKAMELYEQKDFPRAELYLDSYLKANPEDADAVLYLGAAALENANLPKAIELLETARINNADKYEDATWYLALAYIKQGDLSNARAVLQDLTKLEDGFYYQKANDLLADLDKVKQ